MRTAGPDRSADVGLRGLRIGDRYLPCAGGPGPVMDDRTHFFCTNFARHIRRRVGQLDVLPGPGPRVPVDSVPAAQGPMYRQGGSRCPPGCWPSHQRRYARWQVRPRLPARCAQADRRTMARALPTTLFPGKRGHSKAPWMGEVGGGAAVDLGDRVGVVPKRGRAAAAVAEPCGSVPQVTRQLGAGSRCKPAALDVELHPGPGRDLSDPVRDPVRVPRPGVRRVVGKQVRVIS